MKEVIGYIWDWRFLIITILSVLFKAVTDWQGFKTDFYKLMLAAKHQAKEGVLTGGQAQEDWVVK